MPGVDEPDHTEVEFPTLFPSLNCSLLLVAGQGGLHWCIPCQGMARKATETLGAVGIFYPPLQPSYLCHGFHVPYVNMLYSPTQYMLVM